MNVFIPDIGSQIKLTEAWIFQLYPEYRNTIIQALGNEVKNLKQIVYKKEANRYTGGINELFYYEMFLPIDTVLTVRRVYVRQGQKDFSSVTFNVNETTHPFLAYNKEKKKKKICGTFWAKLSDVNKIQCEILKDTAKVFGNIEENDSED